MKSQTVIITDKMGQNTVGLSVCPVAPYDKKALAPALAVNTVDGPVLWYSDKTIKYCHDGRKYTWLKKPTLKDAVESRESGSYYEFNIDGSVNAKINGLDYIWPVSENNGIPELGECVKVHICENANGIYFLGDEKCACETCLYCDERCVNNNFFCSSFCEMRARH